MRKLIPVFAIAALLLSLIACGSDDDSDNNDSNNTQQTTTFECGGTTCNATTQYCLRTRVGSFDAPSSDFCIERPSSCSSCDCLDVEQDFTSQHNGAGNCTGAIIGCAQANNAISASCTKSSL